MSRFTHGRRFGVLRWIHRGDDSSEKVSDALSGGGGNVRAMLGALEMLLPVRLASKSNLNIALAGLAEASTISAEVLFMVLLVLGGDVCQSG